jgi:hypothetical protein
MILSLGKVRLKRNGPILKMELDTIAERYAGIMYQLYRRASPNDSQLTDFIAKVWFLVQQSSKTIKSYNNIPKNIWDSCIAILGSKIDSLKIKFMLRLFVDELPPCDERGFLRFIAFGRQEGVAHHTSETLKSARNSSRLLHNVMLSYLNDLRILTDDAISPEMIDGMEEPFDQYLVWLLKS